MTKTWLALMAEGHWRPLMGFSELKHATPSGMHLAALNTPAFTAEWLREQKNRVNASVDNVLHFLWTLQKGFVWKMPDAKPNSCADCDGHPAYCAYCCIFEPNAKLLN